MTQPEITYAWEFNPRHAVNNEPIPKAQCVTRCGDAQQIYEINYRPDADTWEVRGWDDECQPTDYIGAYHKLDAAQAAVREHAPAAHGFAYRRPSLHTASSALHPRLIPACAHPITEPFRPAVLRLEDGVPAPAAAAPSRPAGLLRGTVRHLTYSSRQTGAETMPANSPYAALAGLIAQRPVAFYGQNRL